MTGQLKQETDLNGGELDRFWLYIFCSTSWPRAFLIAMRVARTSLLPLPGHTSRNAAGDLGFGEKADNVDKCCESCANTDGCEAFTFVTEASTCWLKGNGYTEKVGVTGVVSGMRSDFVVDRSAVVEPPPPPLPHPLDHVTAPDLTKAADQERALSGNKNLDPSVSVAAQTNGYATPSTYSHPSSDPTIPRGKHNYDYHHPVAEAEYLGYEVRQLDLAGSSRWIYQPRHLAYSPSSDCVGSVCHDDCDLRRCSGGGVVSWAHRADDQGHKQ